MKFATDYIDKEENLLEDNSVVRWNINVFVWQQYVWRRRGEVFNPKNTIVGRRGELNLSFWW